jgi:hypothetical protein
MRVLAVAFALLALANQQNIYNRLTIANVIITGSRNLFDGTYVTTGTASICGEIPKMASLTGEDVFVLEFTGNAPANVPSVLNIAFGSKELVRGTEESPHFRLNVTVRAHNGGTPPAFVLNTDPPRSGTGGKAKITYKGKTANLEVTGVNEMNQTITLLVSCG